MKTITSVVREAHSPITLIYRLRSYVERGDISLVLHETHDEVTCHYLAVNIRVEGRFSETERLSAEVGGDDQTIDNMQTRPSVWAPSHSDCLPP